MVPLARLNAWFDAAKSTGGNLKRWPNSSKPLGAVSSKPIIPYVCGAV